MGNCATYLGTRAQGTAQRFEFYPSDSSDSYKSAVVNRYL
jgi:hypothetical protein